MNEKTWKLAQRCMCLWAFELRKNCRNLYLLLYRVQYLKFKIELKKCLGRNFPRLKWVSIRTTLFKQLNTPWARFSLPRSYQFFARCLLEDWGSDQLRHLRSHTHLLCPTGLLVKASWQGARLLCSVRAVNGRPQDRNPAGGLSSFGGILNWNL